jgi:hypothetical protein
MAQRDNRRLGMHHPVRRPSAPLSGAAKYPAGARPSKCISIIERWICHVQKLEKEAREEVKS